MKTGDGYGIRACRGGTAGGDYRVKASEGALILRSGIHPIGLALILLAASCAGSGPSPVPEPSGKVGNIRQAAAPHDFARWEQEIAAFEAADRTGPPPKGGVLFIGSSTIRLWKTLAGDFPDHKVINRGFGGSEIADATHFAERIIFPYAPKQIFLRSGGNDLNAGRLPDEIAADFVDFARRVHGRLPDAEILFISLSPSPARWGQKDKSRLLNRLIRRLALGMPRVGYVDCDDLSLTPYGQARRDLFVDDLLHFNDEGYRLLADRVRPFLASPK